ncbi:hypothetical protein PVAP13_5KG064074 [Panicum virgatum]|uniref:Uncharacterized protein n=1 Tax=Panicum virgatum TaxID=38727 RepID=A0A8T0SAM2_PANVG|nr:hypothetical protein PVAP13_5KG064074 [Panicum virgatum]
MDGAAAAEDPARKAWGGAAASKPIRIFCAGAHTCEPPVVARCSAYTKRSRRIINCLCLCALQFFNESLKCPALRREEIKKQNRKGEQARLSRTGTPGTVTSSPRRAQISGRRRSGEVTELTAQASGAEREVELWRGAAQST